MGLRLTGERWRVGGEVEGASDGVGAVVVVRLICDMLAGITVSGTRAGAKLA